MTAGTRVLDARRTIYNGTNAPYTIEELVASLNASLGGRTIVLDRDYTIYDQLQLNFCTDFTIDGNGHTITMDASVPASTNYKNFLFWKCDRFTVKNLTINANATNRGTPSGDPHAVQFSGCEDFTFDNVTVLDAAEDCVYVTYGSGGLRRSKRGRFINLKCDGAVRSNVIIIQCDGVIFDGGEWLDPTSSSFDIEPNAYALANFAKPQVSGVRINDVYSEGTLQISIGDLANGAKEDVTRDIQVRGCTLLRSITCAAQGVLIDGNTFKDTVTPADGTVVRIKGNSRRVVISNNVFQDITVADCDCIRVDTLSTRTQEVLIIGNLFDNVPRALWARGPKVSFIGNHIYDLNNASNQWAVMVGAMSLVANNYIRNSPRTAIVVDDDTTDVTGEYTTVTGNHIYNCDQTTAGYGAIRAENPCIITDNQIHNFITAVSATVAAGGTSGYEVGDHLVLTGGTFVNNAATFRVTTVSVGVVTGVEMVREGSYVAAGNPGNPVSTTTDGAGVGTVTLNVTWNDTTDAAGVAINCTNGWVQVANNFSSGYSATEATAFTLTGAQIATPDANGNIAIT